MKNADFLHLTHRLFKLEGMLQSDARSYFRIEISKFLKSKYQSNQKHNTQTV